MTSWIIIEDEPILLYILLAMFEVWGIGMVAFEDGDSAIAWIEDYDTQRGHQTNIAGALIDIRLPGISGLDITRRLRQSPRLKNIAILQMSAYRFSPSEEPDVTAAGCDRLLYKPLPEMSELRKIIDETVEERRWRSEDEA